MEVDVDVDQKSFEQKIVSINEKCIFQYFSFVYLNGKDSKEDNK